MDETGTASGGRDAAIRGQRYRQSWLWRLPAAALAALLLAAAVGQTAESRVYRFGVVPQFDLRRLAAIWDPVIAELARRTGLEFELVRAPTIPDFERDYQSGHYDFAYLNPYHAAAAKGYLPLVRDRKPLQGILVVRRASRYRSARDLDGQTIAFPAPNALAASLLMRADLSRQIGIRFEPRYLTTHSLVYASVARGQVAAGGGVQQTFDAQPAALRAELRVVYRTRELPAHPIVAHARVPEAVRIKVRDALLAMGRCADGRARLARIPIEDPVPAGADDAALLEGLDLEPFAIPSDR